jgi:hypothetical protein
MLGDLPDRYMNLLEKRLFIVGIGMSLFVVRSVPRSIKAWIHE